MWRFGDFLIFVLFLLDTIMYFIVSLTLFSLLIKKGNLWAVIKV